MNNYTKLFTLILAFSFFNASIFGQEVVNKTYSNPVIPGDHPDPTLTKVGNHFYTSGSSFNPTPKIYHSTDLVHWEVISQPVSASWSNYGDMPGDGIWGGHMVFYNGEYWHFFGGGGIGGRMYFVKADQAEGPWSEPEIIDIPEELQSQGIGLGVDNSIFIDDDNKWYLLTKAGQSNNHLVELGDDGQPNGNILDLTWLNPESEGLPYGWAEGPVMWKYKGFYYYSFAQHLVGSQYVMRSDTLSDEESEWTIIGTNIFKGSSEPYYAPNHNSPAVMLEDSTSWVIAHSYNRDYKAQGRQGLLCEVIYDENDMPTIVRPSDKGKTAPNLPSSGIPWMVPHSDFFDGAVLNPEWSLLGYTPDDTYSLTERPGWLKLSPKGSSGENTVIKNDGEHNFSLITKLEFDPESANDEAGLWIINGPESHKVKVVSTMDTEGQKVIAFKFQTTTYEVENTIGSEVWLRLIRGKHQMTGYYSSDGSHWKQIGETINASQIDVDQTDFNDFTGNQQGLYTKGKSAYFDFYIYRDAYTAITAGEPAIQHNTSTTIPSSTLPNILTSVQNNDWAMYAGVEFGNNDYQKQADSIFVNASCNSDGGIIEVFIDSISGTKIAEINIDSKTGSLWIFKEYKAAVTEEITGSHDVYFKFSGSTSGSGDLFRLSTFKFVDNDFMTNISSFIRDNSMDPKLDIIYPSFSQSVAEIQYSIPQRSNVSLKIYDINGTEIESLFEGNLEKGDYSKTLNMESLTNGIYFCRLKAGNYATTKKLVSVK